ncbi:MAG: hypothetical protein AB1589_11690 [Cyanobacteriota bacterium]
MLHRWDGHPARPTKNGQNLTAKYNSLSNCFDSLLCLLASRCWTIGSKLHRKAGLTGSERSLVAYLASTAMKRLLIKLA